MIKILNKIQQLPSSKSFELKIKDFLKGIGLLIIICLAETLPELKEIVTGHDFGQYNEMIKILFVILMWLVQRYIKNNNVSK